MADGKAEKTLRIGVLSDIHVTGDASTPILREAFELFRAQKVDGVVIAGDLAGRGRVDELVCVGRVWREVFAGMDVEKLFVYGNHDIEGWQYPYLKAEIKARPEQYADKNLISKNPAAAWKAAFGEDYPGDLYMKRVKGYAFVGAQFKNGKDAPDLAQFLSAHADELEGSVPFFYLQHVHPAGTCSAPWTWGQDDGASTRALSRFPNAVALSGHSHTSLTDERTIRQGDFNFTSVGTASLRYIIPFGGRENSTPFGRPFTGDRQMPDLLNSWPSPARAAHQGMVMTVEAGRILFARYDIGCGEKLGPDWVVPLGEAGALSYEARAKKAGVPQLPKKAVVSVAETKGKSMKGVPTDQVVVSFPPARSSDGARAFDYEVTVLRKEGGLTFVVSRKRVYSPAYFRAESCEPKAVTCVFAKRELPWGTPFTFTVRPLNSFGGAGAAVESKKCKLPDPTAPKKAPATAVKKKEAKR